MNEGLFDKIANTEEVKKINIYADEIMNKSCPYLGHN